MSDVKMSPADSNLPVVATPEELPVKKGDDFIGEFEIMDLGKIRHEQFFVAASQGDREKGGIMSSSVKGPYDFTEMLEEVGTMYKEHQHHAKIYICNRDRNKPNKFLDRNTTDYIEANWEDLLMDGLLSGEFDDKQFTCAVGINEADVKDDPRTVPKEKEPEDEPEQD